MKYRGCRLILLVATAFLTTPVCFGDVIKLTDGEVLQNVTVLNMDDKNVEVQGQYGKMSYPLARVDTIDGVSVHPTPTPAPSAPAAASPAHPGMPSAAGATPAGPGASAVPAGSPQPAANPNGEATPPPKPAWPEYDHTWNMDAILAGMVILSAMWIGSAAAVQRSLFERRVEPRFWSNAAVLLPGIGYLAYQGSRQIAEMKERRLSKMSTNQLVARREKQSVKHRKGFEFLDEDHKAIRIKGQGEQSGLEHAHELLEEALLERASDVHVEPTETEYRVRFRVDGIMQPRVSYDLDRGIRVVSALKTLAQIDVAEKRKAQDGRFGVRTDGNDIDFRVATANSIFGEKVVIRVLNRTAGLLGLSELGMPEAMKEQFERVIHSRNGMILSTGPTGSGKTSTIYSALSQLDAGRLNIMTIEDPVEYGLAGATQLPVNVKAGTTFESGLRSILRQDPDVIFVGEMRDAEAAQIALRAALTGHLVFSSLHTRDAVGTIIRLEEMGMDRHLLASSLLVLIAQRLLRVLCPECREPYPCKADELHDIGIELPEGETIYRPKGCKECGDSGYLGRTGIFEMIVFDEKLRQAVNNGDGETALEQIARENGFSSFREDGARKILAGITSVEEVLQAS